MLFLRLLLGKGGGGHNYDEYQPADVNSAVSFSHAKMQMRVSFSSPLFILNLVPF